MDYSWVALKGMCPVDISEVISYVDSIEIAINKKGEDKNLDELKEKLIIASANLEIMITRLMSLLYDIEIIKTPIDKAIYDLLKDDLTGYMAIVDEKQKSCIEVFDGESGSGIGRTSAFKKVLMVSLYGLIYHSLKTSSIEYMNLRKEDKGKNDFLRIFFLMMSINLSTLGGLPRRKGTGLSTHKNMNIRSIFKKPFEEQVREEYKERYGQDLDFNEEEIFEEEPKEEIEREGVGELDYD